MGHGLRHMYENNCPVMVAFVLDSCIRNLWIPSTQVCELPVCVTQEMQMTCTLAVAVPRSGMIVHTIIYSNKCEQTIIWRICSWQNLPNFPARWLYYIYLYFVCMYQRVGRLSM